MAWIRCRRRNFLICLCTPCICLILLFIYVIVMVSIALNNRATGKIKVENEFTEVVSSETVHPTPENPHFVAPGAVRSYRFESTPDIFWKSNQKIAFWNQLQKSIDHNSNPILRPKSSKTKAERGFSESLLSQSFSEVSDTYSFKQSLHKLPEHLRNYVQFMNRRDYPVHIEPNGQCGVGATDERGPPLLLLAIKTSVQNYKNRQAIRQTWGRAGWVSGQRRNSSKAEQGGYVRRVFLLGNSEMEDLSELLHLESEHYGDILMWDYWDTFFNLTVKDILFWSWFKDTCGQASYVFNGDDDVFVNTPALITFLLDELQKPQAHSTIQDFMVGHVVTGGQPNRNSDFEYFIPESFYRGLYPTYAMGAGVLYSGLLLKRLLRVSKRVHLYPIDDVYVGMCMIQLNLSPSHHPAFLTSDFTKEEEEDPCAYHRVLLVHKRSPSQMVKLWDQRSRSTTLCRDVSVALVTPMKTKITTGIQKHGW